MAVSVTWIIRIIRLVVLQTRTFSRALQLSEQSVVINVKWQQKQPVSHSGCKRIIWRKVNPRLDTANRVSAVKRKMRAVFCNVLPWGGKLWLAVIWFVDRSRYCAALHCTALHFELWYLF